MNEDDQLAIIYSVAIPTIASLFWLCRRRRKPEVRTKWLTESMSFFNTRSSMVVNYWKNVSAQ